MSHASNAPSPVLVIAGPTASGKSRLALDAADAFRGTVINGDSMQLYRELQVLTARPGSGDLARLPHRLYGVLAVDDPASAGAWREMALREIAAAGDEGRLPMVVGGTGLYLKALMEGLSAIPPIPDAVRRRASDLRQRLGAEGFKDALRRLDPVAAARLPANDRQRLIRAYEVAEATGRPIHEWHRLGEAGPAPEMRFQVIVLDPPRGELIAAIEHRVDAMLAAGALDEVRRLEARGLDPELPAMKAVGVPELRAHLRGEMDLDEAARRMKTATRRYAKRQTTWFRRQIVKADWVSAQYSERNRDEIFSIIRNFLLTAQ
jgi:tRNA dimethylallyltransferase